MLGGGLTPVLAAGFQDVSVTFNVPVSKVALTTGFFMLGLGVGGVVMSPTAIVWGKRPVYLATAIMLVATSIWCALSPSYTSLATARVFQGICVSPIEVMPSATVAEIFYLHERASKLGIYTLLLLGGKHLVPLLSAVVIQSAGWRWVFGYVLEETNVC
jgi:MFS family permease